MKLILGAIPMDDSEVMHAIPQDALVVHAATVDELVENVYLCTPDLLLVDAAMEEIDGALRQISQLLPVPVVLIAGREDETVRLHALETDIFAFLIRPFHEANLRLAMAVAQSQFLRLHGARSEASQLRGAFAERKYIDRAKGLIMQRRGLSEGEAYALLREESRRRRTPIVEIARSLLGEPADSAQNRKPAQPTLMSRKSEAALARLTQ